MLTEDKKLGKQKHGEQNQIQDDSQKSDNETITTAKTNSCGTLPKTAPPNLKTPTTTVLMDSWQQLLSSLCSSVLNSTSYSRVPAVEVVFSSEYMIWMSLRYNIGLKTIHCLAENIDIPSMPRDDCLNSCCLNVDLSYSTNPNELHPINPSKVNDNLTNNLWSYIDNLNDEDHNLLKEHCQSIRFDSQCLDSQIDGPSCASSFIIFLAGTSGSGKSTLATLLALFYSIDIVVSTDQIRDAFRHLASPHHYPFLFLSTYEVANYLKAEFKTKSSSCPSDQAENDSESYKKFYNATYCFQPTLTATLNAPCLDGDASSATAYCNDQSCLCVEGFLLQSQLLEKSISKVVASLVNKKKRAIIEGVHLTIPLLQTLCNCYRCCLPFIIYLSSPNNHIERLIHNRKDSHKYQKNFSSIRCIQHYFCKNGAHWPHVMLVENSDIFYAASQIVVHIQSILQAIPSTVE